jgi:hypothetical protein
MQRHIQLINFHVICAVALLLWAISFQVHGQERLCPDGKRSYFGVCPDDVNQSRPLPAPEPRLTPTPSSNTELELKARAFIRDLFVSTSDTNQATINFLNQNMEDEVMFYGKLTKKDEILKAKVKFVARWPVRTYTERHASLKIKCDYSNKKCSVDGIMDWDARNQVDNRASMGVAKFFYEIQFINGAPKITAENSEVIERK